MKKFLSLVLVLVMTMSLVTVSAGAKDFTDSEKLSGNVYEEAVNVMSEMGIIDGYADGSFQPQGTLTRGAAAKIIACMMLGKTTAEALGTQAAPFKDVPVGSTFAGYIAYCSEAGIIDGYSDGTFRPGNTLTGFAFLKMLLTALGYDSTVEGFANNANWTVNVAGRAIEAGLTKGNESFVGTKAATREEACLYAVNTLKATLVEYETKGTSITINGTVISQGASKPTFVTSNIAGAATSIDDTWDNTTHDYTVEFAEKYQPDLALKDTTDAFGRPAHTWTWKKSEIGTYVEFDKMVGEYTTKVTGKDLYDLLGKTTIDGNDVIVYIDGVDDYTRNNAIFTADNMIKTNTKAVGDTGDGVLTQVFLDTKEEEITVAIINTYLAKADDDYDDDKDELDLEVYSYDTTKVGSVGKNIKDTSKDGSVTVDGEKIDVSDYKDGDFVLVTIADGEVQTVAAPEVLEAATLTAFSLTKHTITTGGTTYGEADSTSYDREVLVDYTGLENLKDKTYNVFLDPYGYYIGVELVEDELQYVFVTGYEPYTKNLSTAKADVGAIFLDGKMETITVKVKDSLGWNSNGDPVENSWYSYTVGNDNVYTLSPIYTAEDTTPFDTSDGKNTDAKVAQFAYAYTTAKEIDKAHISLPVYSADRVGGTVTSVVYGNADSVYISVSTEDLSTTTKDQATIIDNVESLSTGIKNTNMTVTPVDASWSDANSSAGVYTLYNNKGYIIASIVVGEDAAATSNYAFVTSKNANLETYSSDNDIHTWTREVIINGALTEIKEQGDTLEWIGNNGSELHMTQGNWYKISYNADGFVTKAELIQGVVGEEPKVVTDIDDIDPDETVLLMADTANKLHMEGWTLFITQGKTDGFAVADDAKAVLIEKVDGDQFDTITYYDSKEDNVKDAIDDLNNNFEGSLYAIFEDGVATSVIIMDSKNQSTEIGGGQTDSKIHVTLDDPIIVTWEDEEPTLKEVISAIESEMESQGYRMDAPTQSGNTFTWEGTSPLGYPATFTWNSKTGISEVVTVNTKTAGSNTVTEQTVAAGTKVSALTGYAGYVLNQKNELVNGTDVVVGGSTYTFGLSAIEGDKGIVYGTPSATVTAEQAAQAFTGTYVADSSGTNQSEVTTLTFPTAATTDDYTTAGSGVGSHNVKDGYFKVDVDGSVTYENDADLTSIVTTGDAVNVNGTMYTQADAQALELDQDMTIVTCYEVSVTSTAIDAAFEVKWDSSTVYTFNNKTYAAKDSEAKLILTVKEFTASSDDFLKAAATATVKATLKGTFQNSIGSGTPSVDGSYNNCVEFQEDVTYYADGSQVFFTLDVSETSAENVITLTWESSAS